MTMLYSVTRKQGKDTISIVTNTTYFNVGCKLKKLFKKGV